MKSITIDLYQIHELDDKAKQKALDELFSIFDFDIDDEIDCIKSIAKTLNLDLSYKFDYCSRSWINLSRKDEYDIEPGIRSLKYIYNNYIGPNLPGKYYSYKSRVRYSKALLTQDTNFTGLYMDSEVSYLYRDYERRYRRGEQVTVDAFLSELAEKLKDCVVSELNCQAFDEYLTDMAQINDYWFLKNGSVWHEVK